MDAFAPYKIPLTGLKDGIHHFDYQIDNTFFAAFDYSFVQNGKFDVHLELDKKPSVLVLNFNFEGGVNVECDRCMEYFDMPIEGDQRLLVKYSEEEREEEEDIVYISPDAIKLNVAKYIYEMILLNIPIRKACEEDEEGYPSCGNETVINTLYCDNDEDQGDDEETNNPFKDAFKDFKE